MGQQEEDATQKLQNRVDKLKTLATLQGIHNLSPPVPKDVNPQNEIQIVKALEVTPRLLELFMEARGMSWNPKTKQVDQISRPYLNVDGAWRLVQICKKIAQEAEWGNFPEDNIPDYIIHFFNINFPYFTFWHEQYDLDPSDFNFVETTLQMFILASFYKGKGGKYINMVGKTYSEKLLDKAISDGEQKRGKSTLDRVREALG